MKVLHPQLMPLIACLSLSACHFEAAGDGDSTNSDGTTTNYGLVEYGAAALCYYYEEEPFNEDHYDPEDYDGEGYEETISGTVTYHGLRDDFDNESDIACDDTATVILAIEDDDGDSWWMAYGITDNLGLDTTPDSYLPTRLSVDLLVRQHIETGTSAAMMLTYQDLMMGAMEVTYDGALLGDDDIDGLDVSDGTTVGARNEDCGVVYSRDLTFTSDLVFSLSPYATNDLDIDGQPYLIASVANLSWSSDACSSAADFRSWAIWYEGEIDTGGPF